MGWNLEVERKFLVEDMPEDSAWPVPYTESVLVQTYLVPLNKKVTSERIRLIISEGRVSFTHTKKIRVSDGVHRELERPISACSYTRLNRRADPDMRPVLKVRRVFDWAGRTFELDLFSPPWSFMMLEVELPSMDTPVELPPFLSISLEVTTDPNFTNAALARKARP